MKPLGVLEEEVAQECLEPCGSPVRLLRASAPETRRRQLLLCCLLWAAGVALALVPLLAGLDFYGQTGICVPLPITR